MDKAPLGHRMCAMPPTPHRPARPLFVWILLLCMAPAGHGAAADDGNGWVHAFASFGQLQAALEERKLPLLSAELEYVAQTPMELPEDKAAEVLALVDALEQDEDVQRVFHNLG